MTTSSGFQPNQEVTNPDFLFGHNEPGALLDKMIERIYQGTNFQLLGERRAGKTSLLRCSASRLRSDSLKIIPIYLNYREHDTIKGNDAAYRLLLAYIHASCTQYVQFADPTFEQFHTGSIVLSSSSEPLEHYEVLASASDYQVRTSIKNYARTLYEQGYGIVLLLDEYEYLMEHTFDKQTGAFFFIRDLTSGFPQHPDKPHPFTYIVAGASPWNKLPDDVAGSPDLNKVTAQLFVSPLNLKSFTKMWEHCLSTSSLDVRRSVATSNIDAEIAYLLAGGWPFYGKLIGEHLGLGSYNEDDIFDAASLNFPKMWFRLEEPEREQILDVARGKKPQHEQDSLTRDLRNRGLITVDADGKLHLCGQLWKRYIEEQVSKSFVPKDTVDSTAPSTSNHIESPCHEQESEKEAVKKRSTWGDLVLALAAIATLLLLIAIVAHSVSPFTLPMVIIGVILLFILVIAWLNHRQGELTETGLTKIVDSALSKLPLVRGNTVDKTDNKDTNSK